MTDHVYTFHGEGEFIPGVPARHLTQEDVDALAPEALDELHSHTTHHTGLYRRASSSARKDTKRQRAGKTVVDDTVDAVDETPDETEA